MCVLQSAPTCLHPCADLTTVGSTQGVRQVTQYADTSCHGRGWKVWTNIACQSQKTGRRGKKQLISRSSGCADKQSHGASANEIWGAWAALPGKVTQGREGNEQSEPPCQKLRCQCDHCTSGSKWAWPRDNSGSKYPRPKVPGCKPPHWLQQHPGRPNRVAKSSYFTGLMSHEFFICALSTRKWSIKAIWLNIRFM